MITITTWEALAEQPHATTLLSERLADFRDQPFSDLCKVLIVEPGDTLADIGSKLEPEYVEQKDGWFELVTVESDDGYGLFVLIEDRPDMDPALLEFCRTH